MILWEALRDRARAAPDRPALEAAGRRVTYGELAEEAQRRADALAGGPAVEPLDGADPIGFLIGVFAASARAARAVAHPARTPPALRELREAAAAAGRWPAAGATVFFSSGSVGPSRAVPLTDENLTAAATAFEAWGELGASDRVAIGLSPAQILGFVRGALNALHVGASAVFYRPGRDPLAEAARLGASRALLPTALVPLAALRAAPVRLGALQCGGGVLDDDAADRVEARRGVAVRAGYGMTESAGLGARQPLARPRRAGSAGLPAPGLRVEIVGADGRACRAGDSGEVRLSGAAVFGGYLDPRDPSPFDAQGRLCTGDVGELDEAGELRVRGRLAFALTSGGRVVSAEEVEAALAEHPAVAEAAAAPLSGAFGVLVVARGPGFSQANLRAHAGRRLPPHGRPRLILEVPELPRTSAGKVDRAAVSRRLNGSANS